MKQTYEAPYVQVIIMEAQQALLVGSGGFEAPGSVPGGGTW
jgi:hypothetical protein